MSKLFQYAVVRYVPDIIRDEAVNVGVLITAVDGHRFEFKFLPRSATVRKLWPKADSALVKNFQQQLTICAKNNKPLGNIGRVFEPGFFDKAREEFNGNLQLTMPRAVIGPNIDEVLNRVYQTSVAEPDVGARPINYLTIAPFRTRERLWSAFQKRDLLHANRVRKEMNVKGKHAQWTFDLGYQNGALNVINSMALNAATPQANLGRALVLKGMIDDVRALHKGPVKATAVVEGFGKGSAPRGSHEAWQILADSKLTIVQFSQLNELINKVAHDLSV
jgi:DUF3037 family protein